MEFLSLEVPYGRNKGEVQDRFRPTRCRPTTRFYFSVERADPRHALFVHEAANSARLLYFKAALEASGPVGVRDRPGDGRSRSANLSPSKYAFVVLSRRRRAARRLRKRAARVRARRRQRC